MHHEKNVKSQIQNLNIEIYRAKICIFQIYVLIVRFAKKNLLRKHGSITLHTQHSVYDIINLPDSIYRKAQSSAYAELEHAVSTVNDGPHKPSAYDIRFDR